MANNVLTRIGTALGILKAHEGEYRDGPWHLPLTGGWLSQDVGQYDNWWQMGYDPVAGGSSPMVEACVSAYSQTIAMCSGDHWWLNEKGGRDRLTTVESSLARILRKPNDYQTINDFINNLTRSLYMHGNAFALALRNDRFEIKELHLMHPLRCGYFLGETGEVFYDLSGNTIIERRFAGHRLIVPQRDVLHVRLHTREDDPLKGLSPLVATYTDVAVAQAMMRQQILFYANQARPSTVLSTEMVITKEQIEMLRAAWNEQSRGLGQGGTPILSAGLKPIQLASTARDSQLADILKLTEAHIALAFRVPLQILGVSDAAPFASTEAMMQSWLAGGLNFALDNIERAFDKLFGLKGVPDEYMEFDTSVLLRSALRDRVEAYASGTRAGIFAPNEARAQFELAKVPDGDDVRMQQQDVPLSYGAELEANPEPAASPPAAEPEAEPDEGDEGDDDKHIDADALVYRLYEHAGGVHGRT
ncbi:MAG TPA: phage portal protein [Gemmatimonadaceae bacterium]|nr:phage portal protein [Gemmatimonadaceae bacterium]